jgi:hypothetical protein
VRRRRQHLLCGQHLQFRARLLGRPLHVPLWRAQSGVLQRRLLPQWRDL